jgi:hypothetical protein
MSNEPVAQSVAFGTSRRGLLNALSSRWDDVELELYGTDHLKPENFVGVFGPQVIDDAAQYTSLLAVYPASGQYFQVSRITGSPQQGNLYRTFDWVVDCRVCSYAIDPTQVYSPEDLELEDVLIEFAQRRNAIIIQCVTQGTGCADDLLLPQLTAEFVDYSAAPAQSGIIIASRTLWSFTQDVTNLYSTKANP